MMDIFNREELLERIGEDEELMIELIELFKEDYPEKIVAIQRGLETGDSESVRKSAHGLKGSAGNLSFNALSERAKNIELAARDGNMDSAAEEFPLLMEELDRLLPMI